VCVVRDSKSIDEANKEDWKTPCYPLNPESVICRITHPNPVKQAKQARTQHQREQQMILSVTLFGVV
jgi:hypothetical protein